MSKEQEKKEGKTVREIIDQARTGLPSGSDVMAKHQKMLAQQLEESYIERILEEEKIKLQRLRETQGTPIQTGQAQNFLQTLFLGRKPDEIKAILDMLEPEHIDKIIAMNNNTFADFKNIARSSGTDAKTIIEAVKTGVDVAKAQTGQASTTEGIIKSMAEMFKTGVDIGRSQVTPQQQPSTLETIKQYNDMFLKPVLDQLAGKDRENLELRMRHVESQRVDPLEYLKSIKQASADLGLSQNTRNEIDLKLEEMREMHDIEMAKYGLETRKWEWQKANEGKTIEQAKDLIKTVTEGPIGKAIENLGSGAADKIRGGSLVKVQCPNCKGTFGANPALTTVTCVHCVTPDAIVAGDFRTIDQITTNEQVLGMSGHTSVLETFRRHYNGSLVQVKASGLLPFRLTPEHPILIADGGIDRLHKSSHKIRFHDLRWKMPTDLKEKHAMSDGDYVIMPIPPRLFDFKELQLKQFTNHRGYSVAKTKKLPLSFPLTLKTGWMLGLYLAEGSPSSNGIRFSLGKHEHALITKVADIVKSIGYSPNIHQTETTTVVALQSRILARAFRHWFGHNARTKRIPEFIMYAKDDQLLESFLQGYQDGDGSQNSQVKGHPSVEIKTASKVVAMQTQLLYLRLGIKISVSQIESGGFIKGRQIKKGIIYELRGYSAKYRPHTKFQENYALVPIRKIRRVSYDGDVLNLRTTDQTYTMSNIIVHNCGATLARGPASPQQTQEPPAPTPQESPIPQPTQEETKANVQQPEQEPAPQ